MTEQVSLHRAGVAYEGHPVLHDIDLILGEHERVALIGANGCGKSSLLRLIHGLLPLCSGQRLQDPNTRLGMMFQRPHMLNTTTQRHVAIGPWLAGMAWRRSMDLAMEALSRVGLEHVAAQSARTLSGGQQQRVALARMWAIQPDVILLDEPTSSLDPRSKQEVEALLEHWMARADAPALVFASHNLGQVKRLATRVIYLEAGRILADLPVRDFFEGPLQHTHPQAHAFVKGVLS
jgi:tungstate transport system ATP-binding protein